MPLCLHRSAGALIGALLMSCTGAARERPAPIVVAAAADLTRTFAAIGSAFEAESGRKVVFNFGSSGLLARQIRAGAPFDVFAAANVGYVDELVRAGACDGATRARYARGRLAIWVKRGLVRAPSSPA